MGSRRRDDSDKRALYESGLNDAAIARLLGCTANNITLWRHSRQLPTHSMRKNRRTWPSGKIGQ